jgi:hypothetical protein
VAGSIHLLLLQQLLQQLAETPCAAFVLFALCYHPTQVGRGLLGRLRCTVPACRTKCCVRQYTGTCCCWRCGSLKEKMQHAASVVCTVLWQPAHSLAPHPPFLLACAAVAWLLLCAPGTGPWTSCGSTCWACMQAAEACGGVGMIWARTSAVGLPASGETPGIREGGAARAVYGPPETCTSKHM